MDKHIPHSSEHLYMQNGLLEKKKKKCRGNRKAQHLRRRIRRREQKMNNNNINKDHPMNQNTIIHNVNNNLNEEQEQIQNSCSLNNQHNSKIKNKRKRQDSKKDDLDVSQSFSQLSISQRNKKKKKSITRNNESDNNELFNVINYDNKQAKNKKKKEEDENENDESLSMKHIQKFKPHYLRVSDQIFKQMLSNAINDDDKTIQSLDTNEKLQFFRQMTEVTNNLYYFDLQRQLWQEYYNINLKEDGIQAPRRLSKSDAKQHNTCHTYSFPKHVIEKRQKSILHQMQRTINELNQYLTKLSTWTTQSQSPIDPNILSNAINECVKKGQQRLKQEFDYKQKMLELNSNDHYLINKVYELQPTEEQLRLAKMIWQATADELKAKEKEEILRKRIFLQRLPATIDKSIDQSIDHVKPMLSNPVLDKDRRAGLISNYSKAVTQYKFDLMTLDLNTLQNIIRGHQQILADLKEKLLQSCNESLKQAIENRQEAMRKRHELYLKHKLNTFFDEAPTTVSNE